MAGMKAEAKREVHIGKVVRNALLFNFRNTRGGIVSDSALLDTVARLFSLLEERRINYLLVGGIALLQYVDGRNTEDIDLIMSCSSLEKLPEIRPVNQDQSSVRGDFEGLQIDLLLTSNPLFEKVRRQYAMKQRFRERDPLRDSRRARPSQALRPAFSLPAGELHTSGA